MKSVYLHSSFDSVRCFVIKFLNMAGSIENMRTVYKKNVFTYVPPSPPAKLIDCSNFFLDFSSRKFLNIGLDPTDEFNTVIHIITPSRFVNISADFLKRIYRLMGNILSFILEQPQKYKCNLFLNSDSITISSMVYHRENMLVIESKIQDGCRTLLILQDFEWSIFEIIERKTKTVKPIIIQQINQITSYLKTNTKVETRTLEDMTNRVKSINNIFIVTHVNDYNFTSQLQLHAAEYIAQRWLDELEKDEEILSDISPPSQTCCTDETDGPYGLQYNTYTDENDGPYGPQYNTYTDENDGPYGPHICFSNITAKRVLIGSGQSA
ncbi:hypothetical protein AGLY_015833 [Aphis glycines]|uniref:Uncharacterized protein n=1 Tax=Aphis glycines TaxID=307491 RepID=A0A6G0SZH3_APHGL|nr:hypothetical protein AGLY_015833 [Aphis glycines]